MVSVVVLASCVMLTAAQLRIPGHRLAALPDLRQGIRMPSLSNSQVFMTDTANSILNQDTSVPLTPGILGSGPVVVNDATQSYLDQEAKVVSYSFPPNSFQRFIHKPRVITSSTRNIFTRGRPGRPFMPPPPPPRPMVLVRKQPQFIVVPVAVPVNSLLNAQQPASKNPVGGKLYDTTTHRPAYKNVDEKTVDMTTSRPVYYDISPNHPVPPPTSAPQPSTYQTESFRQERPDGINNRPNYEYEHNIQPNRQHDETYNKPTHQDQRYEHSEPYRQQRPNDMTYSRPSYQDHRQEQRENFQSQRPNEMTYYHRPSHEEYRQQQHQSENFRFQRPDENHHKPRENHHTYNQRDQSQREKDHDSYNRPHHHPYNHNHEERDNYRTHEMRDNRPRHQDYKYERSENMPPQRLDENRPSNHDERYEPREKFRSERPKDDFRNNEPDDEEEIRDDRKGHRSQNSDEFKTRPSQDEEQRQESHSHSRYQKNSREEEDNPIRRPSSSELNKPRSRDESRRYNDNRHEKNTVDKPRFQLDHREKGENEDFRVSAPSKNEEKREKAHKGKKSKSHKSKSNRSHKNTDSNQGRRANKRNSNARSDDYVIDADTDSSESSLFSTVVHPDEPHYNPPSPSEPESTYNNYHDTNTNQGYSSSENKGPVVHKHIFIHSAPEAAESAQVEVIKPQPQDKHVQIIFVKSPTEAPPPETIVELPPAEQTKTHVYVLSKKPENMNKVKVVQPPVTKPSPPEIYFIRYGDRRDNQGYPVPNLQSLNKNTNHYGGGGGRSPPLSVPNSYNLLSFPRQKRNKDYGLDVYAPLMSYSTTGQVNEITKEEADLRKTDLQSFF